MIIIKLQVHIIFVGGASAPSRQWRVLMNTSMCLYYPKNYKTNKYIFQYTNLIDPSCQLSGHWRHVYYVRIRL